MFLYSGMVIPGVAGRIQVRSCSWGWQDSKLKQAEQCPDPQTILALWFVFHCVLFVLYYKGEKSSKNVEKSCFCHSRDGKASRLSKILANGGSCFQLSSICNFPRIPHLLCCRAGDLTLVSYTENDGTQTALSCSWEWAKPAAKNRRPRNHVLFLWLHSPRLTSWSVRLDTPSILIPYTILNTCFFEALNYLGPL